MSQIASFTKKLQLLEQTREIEEEEADRVRRNAEARNAKYQKLKKQNDLQCLRSSNEVDLRQESAERKSLHQKVRESISDVPWMQPVADLLQNNQGRIFKNT